MFWKRIGIVKIIVFLVPTFSILSCSDAQKYRQDMEISELKRLADTIPIGTVYDEVLKRLDICEGDMHQLPSCEIGKPMFGVFNNKCLLFLTFVYDKPNNAFFLQNIDVAPMPNFKISPPREEEKVIYSFPARVDEVIICNTSEYSFQGKIADAVISKHFSESPQIRVRIKVSSGIITREKLVLTIDPSSNKLLMWKWGGEKYHSNSVVAPSYLPNAISEIVSGKRNCHVVFKARDIANDSDENIEIIGIAWNVIDQSRSESERGPKEKEHGGKKDGGK